MRIKPDFGTFYAGAPSDEVTGMPLSLQPAAVNVESGVESLIVSWAAVTGAEGYEIRWRSGDQGWSGAADPPRHHVVTGAETTRHTIPELIPGLVYEVLVMTIWNAGSDGTSDPHSGVPKLARVTDVVVEPDVESLKLSWKRVRHADGYEVQWWEESDDRNCNDPDNRSGTISAGPGADRVSFVIENLATDAGYTLCIIATRGSLEGVPSRPVTSDPSEEHTGMTPTPAQVTGVTVGPGIEAGSLYVSWDAVAAADGYKVQWRSGDQGYSIERQQTTTVTDTSPGTSYTIPGLTPGAEYTVRVIAVTDNVDGLPSREGTGIPPESDARGVDRRCGRGGRDRGGLSGASVQAGGRRGHGDLDHGGRNGAGGRRLPCGDRQPDAPAGRPGGDVAGVDSAGAADRAHGEVPGAADGRDERRGEPHRRRRGRDDHGRRHGERAPPGAEHGAGGRGALDRHGRSGRGRGADNLPPRRAPRAFLGGLKLTLASPGSQAGAGDRSTSPVMQSASGGRARYAGDFFGTDEWRPWTQEERSPEDPGRGAVVPKPVRPATEPAGCGRSRGRIHSLEAVGPGHDRQFPTAGRKPISG